MRKIFLSALLLVFCSVALVAQTTYVALKINAFSSATTGSVVRLIGSSASYHKISWNIGLGTLSGCSVKLEQSTTGTGGWSDLIAGQTCTSNDLSAITTGTPNYVRINVTTLTVATGTPVLSVTYTGYINDPTGATLSAISQSIIPNTDNTLDLGSSVNAWRNVYYYNLVGKGTVTYLEGPVSTCTTAGASNGRLQFTATGPQWSYNTGACQSLLLASPSVQTSTTDSIVDDTVAGTETAFATQYTIPASFFNAAGKTLRVTLGFEVVAAVGPPTLQMKVRLTDVAGTIIFSHSAVAPAASVTRAWGVTLLLVGTGAAGASVNVHVLSPNMTFDNGRASTIVSPIAMATNGDIVLVPTAQWASNAANTHTVYLRGMIIEVLK